MQRRSFIKVAIGAIAAGPAIVKAAIIAPVEAVARKYPDSKFTRALGKQFLDSFEAQRMLNKTVSNFTFQATLNDTVTFRRPIPLDKVSEH